MLNINPTRSNVIRLYVLSLSFLLLVTSFSAFGANRRERDTLAKEAFFNLNFAGDGKGMIMSPGLIGVYKKSIELFGDLGLRAKIRNRWGLNFDPEDPNSIVGLFEENYKGERIGAIGCVACHSGRAAGQLIIGLGNKNVDVLRLAKDVHRVEKWWKWFGKASSQKSEAYKAAEQASLKFSKYLANEEIGNLTQGLVPVSFIRGWFYRIQNLPLPEQLSRGQVKIPALWGYGEKRKVGQFCDGYGDGTRLGWAVAVELAAGQTTEYIRKIYSDVVKAEHLLEDFLPPKYPFSINLELAAEGQRHYERTCAHCHGTYKKDSQGLPTFEPPQFIPWRVVKTDFDRLAGNTKAFGRMIKHSPLNDIIRINDYPAGYFALRLDGIWSRFPYLHNASVPNMQALLTPPKDRPKLFSLKNSGEVERFDTEALGLRVTEGNLNDDDKDRRDVYDTSRVGHSNQGHDFYTRIPARQKSAIIEYLKTL